MWNSPNKTSDEGKRYKLEDLSALALPLDEILGFCHSTRVADFVDEPILKRLERDELVFALYQTLDALMEDTAVPEKGHPGIQEAIVSELLSQAHAQICCELDDPESGHGARKAAWTSIDRLLIPSDQQDPSWLSILEEIGVDPTAPEPHRSEALTHDVWEDLLLSEFGLWGEFLWDADWRVDSLMDLPPDRANHITQQIGIDLEVVQALPHTPNAAELKMAENYLSNVIRRHEAQYPEASGL